jgi:hypothetical protein
VSVIIRIRIFREMNLVNNLPIFFCIDVHVVGTVVLLQVSGSTNWESYLFYVLSVVMYHPICILALVIFISHFLHVSTFCLPVLLFLHLLLE